MNDELGQELVEQTRAVAEQVREVDKSLGLIVVVLFVLALWGAIGVRINCNYKTASTNEDRCLTDCHRRAVKPERAAERARYNDGECWCFDEKTGETTRLW